MGKTRDLAILCGVEGGIILACLAIPRVAAKPAPPAAARVVGLVRDQQTNLPIPYASVTIDTIPCPVDEDGYFTIDTVPLGKYTVKASAPGYRPVTLEWDFTEAKEYLKEIELTPIETLW